MKNVKKFILRMIALLFVAGLCLGEGKGHVLTVLAAPLEKAETREVKVLVIAIDPQITNPMTGEQQKASEYMGFSLEASVSSLKRQLEAGSNQVVEINVTDTMWLDEFPVYKGYESMSESQFHKLFPVNAWGQGEWYGWWSRNSDMQVIPPELDAQMHYDYEHLLEKCQLVELRNEGKFDMVWVFGIDPLSMYESAMVGREPLWINGVAVEADCENFPLLGLTFSRRDGAIESFCHMCESLLGYVYGVTGEEYNQKLKFTDFEELNTWEKFYYCEHKSDGNNEVYGVGQVHFSPNSTADYDWENQTPVLSYHQSFLEDYPNVTDENPTVFTAEEYLKDPEFANEGPTVCHHVWWLRHMPHYAGRDENGYSHNWWDYLLNMNHVTGLAADEQYGKGKVVLAGGDTLSDVSFQIQYHTGEKKTTSIGESGATVTCKEGGIFAKADGRVVPVAVGTEKIAIMYDGHALEYTVEVTEVVEGNAKTEESVEEEVPEETIEEVISTEEVSEENVSNEMPSEEIAVDVSEEDEDAKDEASKEESEEPALGKKIVEVVKERPLMAVAVGTVLCAAIVVVFVVIMKRKKK